MRPSSFRKISAAVLFCLCAICVHGQERTDTLDASRITTERSVKGRNSTQTSLQHLDPAKLQRGFALFNTPDLIKTLQSLPGVAAGTELMSGLYVRGGDGSDNLFLLDGAPLYQAGHFGGIFSSFNSDLIETVDFYKGGFPARYGGKMSSVVDVSTKDGDFEEFHGTFALGLIDGRVQVEGPIVRGRTSFNVGLRRTWLDVVTTPMLWYANWKVRREEEYPDQFNASYNFSDFNATLTHKFSEQNRLKFSFFAGLDRLPFGIESPKDDGKMGKDGVYRASHYGEDNIDISLKWGNILGTARWDCKISRQLSGKLTAYYSRNLSQMGVSLSEWSWENEKDCYARYGEGVYAIVEDTGLKAEADYYPNGEHHIRFGGNAAYHSYNPSRRYYIGVVSGSEDNVAHERHDVFFDGLEAAFYAEDEMSIASFLTGNVGLRSVIFGSSGKTWTTIEPRCAFKLRLSPQLDLRASWAEMNQFTHQISTCYIDLPTNTWMPSTGIIKPMRSRQASAGLYAELGKGLDFFAEGWYKTMDHLYEYAGINMLYPPLDKWETEFVEGRGRSWGLETGLEYGGRKLSAQLYYTLSWNFRRFEDIYEGWYPDRNDNRHKLTLMANYSFTPRFEAYAAWNFHSGNHLTAVTYNIRYEGEQVDEGWELYDVPNSVQLPAYHRMDLGLSWHKETARGNLRTWNLSIYNAYCRMNAVFATVEPEYTEYWDEYDEYHYDRTGRYKGRALGLVPIIPTFGYTLKF